MYYNGRWKSQILYGVLYGRLWGSQEVDILQSGFERLRDAELAVEKEVGSQNCNGGKSAYELMLLNSGIEEAEGKKIGDILKLLWCRQIPV